MDEETQGHRVYPSLADLLIQWGRAKPLSGVLVGNSSRTKEFYCCARDGAARTAIQFQLAKDGDTIYSFGLHYHQFERVEEEERVDWEEMNLTSYAMLLPLEMGKTENGKHLCALVSSDWMCLGEDGRLVNPHMVVLKKEFEKWRRNEN